MSFCVSLHCTSLLKEDLLEREDQLKCWSPLPQEQIFALAFAGLMWEANCILYLVFKVLADEQPNLRATWQA